MIIKVTKDIVSIVDTDQVHKGEYNVNNMSFEFSSEYDSISKMAVFSNRFATYETPITNNTCIIPSEVLAKKGLLTIGVYGYTSDNGVIVKRYSPAPTTIEIENGSYLIGQNPQEQNPTQFEEFVEQLEGDIDGLHGEIEATQTDVETIQADVGTLQTQVGTMQTQVGTIQNQVGTIQNQVGTLQTQVGTIQTQVATKQDKLTAGDNITISNNVISSYAPTMTSQLTNDSGFINKNVNDLVNYELKADVGHSIQVTMNTSTFVMTINLKNSAGTVISTQSVDLPLETMVVNANYDSTTKEIVLILQSGAEVRVSVADLVSGLQAEITSTNKLDSDLVDDTNQANKFVTTNEKTNWNSKYEKPTTRYSKNRLVKQCSNLT